MLGLLFFIVVGLPAYVAVFNFIHEQKLFKNKAVTNDMKNVIHKLGLREYWDFTFWDD